MADTEDSTKKIVVLKKESKFFMPENGSPIPTRTVPKTDSFKDSDLFRNLESSFEEERDENDESLCDKTAAGWSYRGPCLLGICAILLVLLFMLLAYGRTDASSPFPHSVVVAALAGTLGYTVAQLRQD